MKYVNPYPLSAAALVLCLSVSACGSSGAVESVAATPSMGHSSASSEKDNTVPRLDGLGPFGTWCKENLAPSLTNMRLPLGSTLSGDYLTNDVDFSISPDSNYPEAIGKCYIGFETARDSVEGIRGDQRVVIFGVGDLRDKWSNQSFTYPDSFVYAGGMTFASTWHVTPRDGFSARQVNTAARAAAIMRALVDWHQ